MSDRKGIVKHKSDSAIMKANAVDAKRFEGAAARRRGRISSLIDALKRIDEQLSNDFNAAETFTNLTNELAEEVHEYRRALAAQVKAITDSIVGGSDDD